MNSRGRWHAIAGTLVFLCGMPQLAHAGPIERGRAIAEVRCGVCHAVGESDDSPLPQAPVFRELSERYPVESLQEGLAEGIITGHAAMPEIAMEPTEISDFLAYLKAIQSR